MKTRILKVERDNPDPATIEIAAEAIRQGRLVAFPTETVYGLGANALDPEAVLSIFKTKGRPADNPLIAHVASKDEVNRIAFLNDLACRIIDHFWPGPLTLVLPAREIVPAVVTAGLTTVAVRMPSNSVATMLIQRAGVPIAGPSANRSGRPSPTDARSVYEDLGDRVSVILDSGATEVGVESTVIDVTGKEVVLLRPGGLPLEKITKLVGRVLLPTDQKEIKRSPGTRYRHYAPLVPLLLWEQGTTRDDIMEMSMCPIGFLGIHEPPFTAKNKIIFPDLDSYARNLFSSFRILERAGVKTIIAEFPDEEGVGLALRDRLRRAASQ